MTSRKQIRIGTRGSKLALAQTNQVRQALAEAWPKADFSVNIIKTLGDSKHDQTVEQLDRIGIFTAELDSALLEDRIDLAVHSLKDLPFEEPKGIKLAAVTERVPVQDILVLPRRDENPQDFGSLPRGISIGTSSLRRRAMINHHYPGFNFMPMRGNLDTRLRKLGEGQMDSIIVARAGVIRLDFDLQQMGFNVIDIPHSIMLPAAGQAALAIETRADDEDTKELVRVLNHQQTHTCIMAERSSMSKLGLGCRVPAGFYARLENSKLVFEGEVAHLSGNPLIREKVEGPVEDPIALGVKLAERLIERGAEELMKASRG